MSLLKYNYKIYNRRRRDYVKKTIRVNHCRSNNGKFYCNKSFEQIRVDDVANLDTLNGMVVGSEESIYFYDNNYKSIRKISRIEK